MNCLFLITGFKLLKLLSVVCGFGSQTYVCKNYIQNICSAGLIKLGWGVFKSRISCLHIIFLNLELNFSLTFSLLGCWIILFPSIFKYITLSYATDFSSGFDSVHLKHNAFQLQYFRYEIFHCTFANMYIQNEKRVWNCTDQVLVYWSK